MEDRKNLFKNTLYAMVATERPGFLFFYNILWKSFPNIAVSVRRHKIEIHLDSQNDSNRQHRWLQV